MAYRPNTGTQILDNDFRLVTSEAAYEALLLKLDTALKGANNGLAELDGSGKVPVDQIPDIGLVDVSIVADETARLALSVQEGDIALQTDNSKSYIYDGSAWQELTKDSFAKAAAVVDSSAGNETDQAMSVSAAKLYVGSEIDALDTDDIEEGSSNLYFTDQRAKDAAIVDSSAGNETDQGMSVSAAKLYVGSEIDALDTDDIEEGSVNLYFTDQRAKDAVVVNSSAGSETDQSMSVSASKSYAESQKVEAQKLLGDVEVFSANGNIDSDNMVCLVDLTGGSVTLTLPNVSGLATGRRYLIKDQKGLASSTVFITIQRQGSSELIDGASNYEMKAAYESISVMFDGTNWLIF